MVAVDDQVSRQAVEPAEDGDPSDLALARRDRRFGKIEPNVMTSAKLWWLATMTQGRIFEPLAVLDGDVPAHHPHDAAAEDAAVDVERLSVAGTQEQPDDPQPSRGETRDRRRGSRGRRPPAPSLRGRLPVVLGALGGHPRRQGMRRRSDSAKGVGLVEPAQGPRRSSQPGPLPQVTRSRRGRGAGERARVGKPVRTAEAACGRGHSSDPPERAAPWRT